MKKPLELEFRANAQSCNYSWKMSCTCKDTDQLRAAQAAINVYLDMKIAEAESAESEGK